MSYEYYANVDDLPIFNWAMINENNKIQYIRKDQYNEPVVKEDIEAWKAFSNTYSDDIGQSKNYTRYVELLQESNELMAEYIATNNVSLLNDIKIIQSDIDKVKKEIDDNDSSIFDMVVAIHQHLGIQLTPQTTTVRMFFKYLEQLNKNGRASNK